MLAANPDASYMMAVTESSQTAVLQGKRTYGVCMVDITTSKVIIGQVLGNCL